MSRLTGSKLMLSVPPEIGRAIVENAAVMRRPLLGTDKFLRFCKARDLSVDRRRLLHLERLGAFSPVFRARQPDDIEARAFDIPIRKQNNWFDKGWAWDTTAVQAKHATPEDGDRTQEGYYSVFQIAWLKHVLDAMTLHVQLDSYLGTKDDRTDTNSRMRTRHWLQHANSRLKALRAHEYQRAVGLLCQYVTNRYYPMARGDQRSVRVGQYSAADAWINLNGHAWDEHEFRRSWDPRETEARFALTPDKLQHAYEGLCATIKGTDPLNKWAPLVQFVSADKRDRLQGAALQAQTLIEGARMLKALYEDLYGEHLALPHEVGAMAITPMPEPEVRNDPSRHLELVVNSYGLNPQPKVALFLEGATEEHVVNRLFAEGFGFPPGRCAIELVVLCGVDNATGSKKEDRFRAIFRLLDYLHHHQTITFLILDNENHAHRLKDKARDMRSIHGHRARVTRPEYVRIWKQAFEFDNFSDTELAAALTKIAESRARFSRTQVAECRATGMPGADLKRLYREVTGYELPKLSLADALVDCIFSPTTRRAVANRPIVRLLQRVVDLAVRNPFPVMQEIWEKNQSSPLISMKR